MTTTNDQDQEDRNLLREGIKAVRDLGASLARNSPKQNENNSENSTANDTIEREGVLQNDAPVRQTPADPPPQAEEPAPKKSFLRVFLGG